MSKTAQRRDGRRFPSWRYGPGYTPAPDGKPENPEFARIFNSEDDVPKGWVDHPSKLIATAEDPKKDSESGGTTTRRRGNKEPQPTTAELSAEETRKQYLAVAQAKFGAAVVAADTTLAELISGLGGEAAALEALKAFNGNRR